MTQSVKAILQLTLMVALLSGLFAWIIPSRPDALIWSIRIAGPIIGVACGVALFINDRRRDLAPDILRQQFGGYFFRNGVAFVIRLTTLDAIAWLEIFVQNHHAKSAVARIMLRPYRRANSDMQVIDEEIEVAGGAVKVRRIPLGIPAHLAGKNFTFDVSADVRFPDGAGRLLRFKEGAGVRSTSDKGGLGCTAALLGAGVLFIKRPARLTLALPAGTAETVSLDVPAEEETLWEID